VRYRYRVDGREFVGNRATSSNVSEEISQHPQGPSAALRELLQRVPVGATVPVHIRPDDPSESYLLYVENPGSRRLLVAGIALAIVSAALLVMPVVSSRIR
jgi:hypothetical protein